MSRFLSRASCACIGALLIGGVLVSFGQVAGILVGNAAVVELFGTTVLDVVCIIAGLAGIFAFLRRYMPGGNEVAAAERVDAEER